MRATAMSFWIGGIAEEPDVPPRTPRATNSVMSRRSRLERASKESHIHRYQAINLSHQLIEIPPRPDCSSLCTATLSQEPKKQHGNAPPRGDYAALATATAFGSSTSSLPCKENGGTSPNHFIQQEQLRRLDVLDK